MCGLKQALGVDAPCEQCSCVFWRHGDATTCTTDGCVLDRYGLIGTSADCTTRWLYDYKTSAERAHIAAQLRQVHLSMTSRSTHHTRHVGVA